jgi:hypothetical protein
MKVFKEAAKVLNMEPEELERQSVRSFMERELANIEAEIFKIGSKHGVTSILELDKKLKRGEVTEEDMLDDFTEFDFLESRKNELARMLGKIK